MTCAPPSKATYQRVLVSSFRNWYDNGRDLWSLEPEMREFVDRATTSLGLPPGARALDIGAGRGADSRYLLDKAFQVVAIDLYRMEEWDELERSYPGRLEFVQADFLDWPGEPASFALAVDNGCFHHQHPDVLDAYVSKIHDLLAPGGLLALNVFCDPSRSGTHTLALPDGRLVHILSEASLQATLAQAGLRVARMHRVARDAPHFRYDYLYVVAVKDPGVRPHA